MEKRLARLRETLVKLGIDGVVIAKPENRHYFSGFTGSSGMLLVSCEQAHLITDFRYLEQAAAQAPAYEIVRYGTDIYATLQQVGAASGLAKLGFEEDFVTWAGYQLLSKVFPQAVGLDVDHLRMVKDQLEIQAIGQAVAIADQAFHHILPFLKPGVREQDIALELEFQMRKQGAEKSAFDIIVASGVRSALPHGRASEKAIASGDFVTMDFGAVYAGYHSDMTRTVVVGQASDQQRQIYEVVLQAQITGLAAIKPGASCKEVDAAARSIIQAAGYGEYFGHGLGHGVGLAIHEDPRLSPAYDCILAEGMAVTVEPGIYLPDWGGVRIEDTVVVSVSGADILTESSKNLIELEA